MEAAIVERIRRIQAAHPCWGSRRIWAWWGYREGLRIHNKRGYRVLKEAGLLLKSPRRRACRTPKAKPPADRPRQCWGLDRTQCLIPAFGGVYRVIVLDWYTQKIVGWDLARRSRRQEGQAAFDRAWIAECPQGVRGAGLKRIADNGSQPTSTGCMAACATLGVEQICTRDDPPQGNAETERMLRAIQEERWWLNECGSLEEAWTAIGRWIGQDDHRE
jgi:putative transposase